MNVRLSFLLVAVLLIFGGTFLAVRLTRSEEKKPDQPWLFRIDEDAITHIEVTFRDQDGQVKRVDYDKKPGSDTWYIQGDPDVAVYLQKWSGTTLLLSGPMVNRVLASQIDNPAAYGLDPPRSTIKVTERSGLAFEFHMGIPTPDGQNQYARLVGDPKLFTVPEICARVDNDLVLKPPYPPPDATLTPGPG
jgi:hypothetical protein